MKFLARNLALCGAVCLLLAEVTGETRTIFAGVPTLDDNTPKNYLQLSGTFYANFGSLFLGNNEVLGWYYFVRFVELNISAYTTTTRNIKGVRCA